MNQLQQFYERIIGCFSQYSPRWLVILVFICSVVFIVAWYKTFFLPLERLRSEQAGFVSVIKHEEAVKELARLGELRAVLEQKVKKIDHVVTLMGVCNSHKVTLLSYTNNSSEMITMRITGSLKRIIECIADLVYGYECAVHECVMTSSARLGAIDAVLSVSFVPLKQAEIKLLHLDIPSTDPFDRYRITQGEKE